MSQVLHVEDILTPDRLATDIATNYIVWEALRSVKISEWREIQEYIFATDTTKTSNSKLAWSNKTTIPKLCQIRDNLYSNYMATLFPKRKWLDWEGDTRDDESMEKRNVIEAYMQWVIDKNEFYSSVSKLVLDWIDYGNCFAMPEWIDERSNPALSVDNKEAKEKSGYVGPGLRRISPLDIVFNPTASSFSSSPKIIRSLVSIGEVKDMLEKEIVDPDEREELMKLYTYMKDIRGKALSAKGQWTTKDRIFDISGFSSFYDYLASNTVEILTFYGDIYDEDNDVYLKNQIIKVVDRHKLLSKKDNPSIFGSAPIFHVGWRVRPDNLWAMGPLDNLVGMQYRIDHLENMKADVFDLIAYPPIKIVGYVEEFNWGPLEKIIVGEGGDVQLLSPDVQALQADTQIAILEQKMEEMSGSPKEAAGFRTPGEKTMYEVQRLENAASRIFENKTRLFETLGLENWLNAMLELARRNLSPSSIRVFDSELKIATFMELTAEDLTGNGRLKPVAARHFAEQAQVVQNLNNFFSSPIGQDPSISVHFSGVAIAEMFEDLLDIERYNLVSAYVRLSEQADAQKLTNIHQEQVAMETSTPGGVFPGDYDLDSQAALDDTENTDV